MYSNQFPRRKKKDGTPVRKYGDLIEYLLSKLSYCMNCQQIKGDLTYSTFGIVEMDFDGKNLLIYYLADQQPLSDPYGVIEHIARGPAKSEHWWKLTDGHKN